MDKKLNLLDKQEDWGYLIVDSAGRLAEVSEDFCANFSIDKKKWVGVPIKEVIKRNYSRKQNKVIFGTIFGYACLIRVAKVKNQLLYRVIVRQEDLSKLELTPFMKMIEPGNVKKTLTGQSRYSFDDIIGESPAIEHVKELAARIATSSSTVLLTGESGTGKELFAQAIHGLSTRKNNPFIAVNCVAIPEELFESELFGYEAGAFSGAKKEGKPGKIELAETGTLFLDEISELPYKAQGKLLRVLQEREIDRLGGTGSKNVDIRIIVATNRNLKTLVQEGKFRQDLFYRLFVFDLLIPSLRQRKADILPLAHSFINYFNEKWGTDVTFIEPQLQKWIVNYEWPGNVRELKAYIERGMNLVKGDTLLMDTFHPRTKEPINLVGSESRTIQSLEEEVRRTEINVITRALQEAKGNRTLAAQMLEIHIASLYRKIAKYNLK